MTASSYLCLIALGIAVIGWQARALADDDDVTVVPAPATKPAPSQQSVAGDGTPVIHKSAHKKKKTSPTAITSTATVYTANPTPPAPALAVPAAQPQPPPGVVVPITRYAQTQTTAPPPHAPINPVSMISQPHHLPPAFSPLPIKVSTVSIPVAATTTDPVHAPPLVPTVETGLPVARYPGMNGPITGVSTYIPTPTPMPVPAKSITGTTTHPYYASIIPASVIPLTSSSPGNYTPPSPPPSRTTSPPADFVFTNFTRRTSMTYPWKRDIITTEFWIGEGGSSISSTDNIGSAWDEHWRSTNRGNDDPEDRNGYASADHASTVNPFYVALPFNDLAFPDKARDWVYRSWHRPNQDGKQVSACKDRWVCIKNSSGRLCFAQWEDVGPLRTDHAEYVFGNDRPDTYTRAGLDISPAVAKYLGIDENHKAITSWRFVDDEDVPPGAWLKYDEQAVIFTAMHQLRSSNASDLPIQRSAEPIDDQNIESNKKKVDQSKG